MSERYIINPPNAQHRRPDAFSGSDRPAEIPPRRARSIPHRLHPKMKFLNCDYLDRGATQRRHVRATGIRFIGKEAHQWYTFSLGLSEDAQIDYGQDPMSAEPFREELRQAASVHRMRRILEVSGIA
jgi:hypothetical protein